MDPASLKYQKTHEWASREGDVVTIGITDFAVAQLTDLVYIDLPAGYRIDSTDRVVQRVNDWLLDEDVNPEVTSTIAYVGTGGPRFFLVLDPVQPNPHVAFMVVNTESYEQPGLHRRLSNALSSGRPIRVAPLQSGLVEWTTRKELPTALL